MSNPLTKAVVDLKKKVDPNYKTFSDLPLKESAPITNTSEPVPSVTSPSDTSPAEIPKPRRSGGGSSSKPVVAPEPEPEPVPVSDPEKGLIIMGVGKDDQGQIVSKNIGAYLTEEQRQEVNRLSRDKGRLDVRELVDSASVNDKGETVRTQGVVLSYSEKQEGEVFEKVEERAKSMFTGGQGEIGVADKPKGFVSLIDKQKQKALTKQDQRASEGKGTYENIPILFGLGVAQGVYNVGKLGVGVVKAVVQPRKTGEAIAKAGIEVYKNPRLLIDVPVGVVDNVFNEFARNPIGVAGEVSGSIGTIKVASVGVKAVVTKVNAPKIVGETKGSTLKVDLADDVSKSTSVSKTSIKAGSKKYDVESITRTIDRADDGAGARLQSSKTDLNIQTLSKKGEVINQNTGFAKSEVVVSKTTNKQIFTRGDTVQATNVGGKSIVRQGDLVGTGEVFKDGSRITTVVKTGKPVKTSVISSADDLKITADKTKRVTSIESSSSTKVLEFQGPVKEQVQTSIGKVELSSKATFKQTLYDDLTNTRAGGYLSKSDKKLVNLKVDPYSQSISQKDVSIGLKQTDDIVSSSLFKPSSTSSTIVQGKSNSISLQTKNSVSNSPTNPTSSQALTAVQDLVNVRVEKTALIVDKTSKSAQSVAVLGVSSSKVESEPVQSSKVESVIKVEKSTVSGFKSFSSTQTILKQETTPETIITPKTSTRSSTVNKSLQETIVSQPQRTVQTPIITITKPVTMTRQTPTNIPTRVIIPYTKPIKPNQTFTSPRGFAVFVRERGVFKQVGRKTYSFLDAKDVGAYTVANTPRATFKIKPSSGRVSTIDDKKKGSFRATFSNLYVKGPLFIEKREKRIKTSGEKAGITYKGILASKQKRMFRGLNV